MEVNCGTFEVKDTDGKMQFRVTKDEVVIGLDEVVYPGRNCMYSFQPCIALNVCVYVCVRVCACIHTCKFITVFFKFFFY